MSALRQRAAALARQSRPSGVRNVRSYASDHGSHHHGSDHGVEESLGAGFYIALAAIPASYFVYSVSRPDKDGNHTTIGQWLENAMNMKEEWAIKNHNNTAAIQAAAYDKHLFYNIERNRHVELTYPEIFQHGSPYNVPAGHSVNLDQVVAHYRQQHLNEEERKAKKLAAAAK